MTAVKDTITMLAKMLFATVAVVSCSMCNGLKYCFHCEKILRSFKVIHVLENLKDKPTHTYLDFHKFK